MNKSTITKNVTKWGYTAINIIMLGYLLYRLYIWITLAITHHLLKNTSWGVTEFLVNYQDGYVRRGLFGELLLMIYKAIPNIDPRWHIGIVCIISFFIVSVFVYLKIQRNELCWWVLPLNVCMLGACFIRKDFLCALLVLITLQTYTKVKLPWLRLIFVSFLTIISLNIHECFFFMCIPFIVLLYYSEKSISAPIKLIGIAAPLLSMFFICLNKGDKETALAIWNSWSEAFPNFKNTPPLSTINSIGWDTANTLTAHLKINFFTRRSYFVMGWYSKPIIWIAILYILPNILFIKQNTIENTHSYNTRVFIQIMLFQFFSLLPMFTVLSCDGSRICFYWFISTMLIYFSFDSKRIDDMCPKCLLTLNQKLQKLIFNRYSKYISSFLLLFVGISPVGTYVFETFVLTVFGTYAYLSKHIASYIWGLM